MKNQHIRDERFCDERNRVGRNRVGRSRHHHRRGGQAIIEMAIVLPVLLILSMLLVQFGIVMNASSTLTNLSREGARFAATQPALDDAIEARIQQVCPPSIRWANIQNNITITPAQNAAGRTMSGQLITVQITYDMRNKLFLPTRFFGITLFSTNYTTYTTMMIE